MKRVTDDGKAVGSSLRNGIFHFVV